MFAPALLSNLDGSLPESVVVVDESGCVGEELLTDGNLPYQLTTATVDEVLADSSAETIVIVGANAIDDPRDISLYTHGNSSVQLESVISSDLKHAIETIRLRGYDIYNLEEIMAEVNADVMLSTHTIDDNGNSEASDTFTGYIIGVVMSLIMYMFIMIYGQLVMQSVIEEKANRVLELIVTSVRPLHLMLGKIIGVGAVAVTQVLIWVAIIVAFIQFVLPAVMGPEMLVELEAMRNGTLDISTATTDPAILQSLAMVSSFGFIFSVFGYMIVFLVGGFMLYASIYAAIGAAVDNPQDGAQLQVVAMVPIIIGFMFSMTIGANPNSEAATLLSIIPFTSPMVMLARIPSGVPAGEIIASIAALYATIFVTIWFTAKIYRVGIFMYGKKPTIKELIKWARY